MGLSGQPSVKKWWQSRDLKKGVNPERARSELRETSQADLMDFGGQVQDINLTEWHGKPGWFREEKQHYQRDNFTVLWRIYCTWVKSGRLTAWVFWKQLLRQSLWYKRIIREDRRKQVLAKLEVDWTADVTSLRNSERSYSCIAYSEMIGPVGPLLAGLWNTSCSGKDMTLGKASRCSWGSPQRSWKKEVIC